MRNDLKKRFPSLFPSKKEKETDLLSLIKQGNKKVELYLCEVSAKQFVVDVRSMTVKAFCKMKHEMELKAIWKSIGKTIREIEKERRGKK